MTSMVEYNFPYGINSYHLDASHNGKYNFYLMALDFWIIFNQVGIFKRDDTSHYICSEDHHNNTTKLGNDFGCLQKTTE